MRYQSQNEDGMALDKFNAVMKSDSRADPAVHKFAKDNLGTKGKQANQIAWAEWLSGRRNMGLRCPSSTPAVLCLSRRGS